MLNGMGVSHAEPDFRHVHLQWFAEGDEGSGDEGTEGEGGEANVEDKVAELEKTLKNLQKDLSGKDRTITRLMEEKKGLESKKSKQAERERRKSELDDMSAEELKREIERREEEIKNEYERVLNEILEQNKQNEYIQTIYRVAPTIENLPPFVLKLLTIPKEADEEKLKEVMESVRDDVNALVNKNRLVIDNKTKTSFRPQSGEVNANRIPTNKEWEKMSEPDRKAWAKMATDEQMKKFNEQQFK